MTVFNAPDQLSLIFSLGCYAIQTSSIGLDFNPSMQHTINCVSARSVAHETTTSNLLHGYPEEFNVGALEKGRFSSADCPVI